MNQLFIEIPEDVITVEQNSRFLFTEYKGEVDNAAGYFTINKRDLHYLSEREWDFLWKRYPGPSSVADRFYAKDNFFQVATEEQIRNALKVAMVESKIAQKENYE
jgi:hypothetical protein